MSAAWNSSNKQSDLQILQRTLGPKINEPNSTFNEVIETDILAREPWHLPGMDSKTNVGWYFWKQKTKTINGKNIDRTIKEGKDRSYWHGSGRDYVLDEDTRWGEKRPFTHKKGSANTGWMMIEYALAPSRVKVGSDNRYVLCKIYKSGKNQKHGEANDCIPQRNQETQNAAAGSSSLVVPNIPETHSGDAAWSTMNLDPLQPQTTSPGSNYSASQNLAVVTSPSELQVVAQETHPTAIESRTMPRSSTAFPQGNLALDRLEPPWGGGDAATNMDIQETHSGDAAWSTMNLDPLQPQTTSPGSDYSASQNLAVVTSPSELQVVAQETHPTAIESRTMPRSSTTFPQGNLALDRLEPPWGGGDAATNMDIVRDIPMWEVDDAAMEMDFDWLINQCLPG